MSRDCRQRRDNMTTATLDGLIDVLDCDGMVLVSVLDG